MSRKIWTATDDALLRRYINCKKWSDIAVELNTSIASAKIRAQRSVGGGVYNTSCSQQAYQWMLTGRRQVSQFAEWLYVDSVQCMGRKYSKFVKEGLL